MKKIIISILLLSSLFSCDKKENNVENTQFLGCTPGGCALDVTGNLKNALIENDTVTYTLSDGELEIMVGFNATCCGTYNTSSEIKNDTIFVNIVNAQIGMCDCICYYTYNFKYSGVYMAYKYKVSVDDYRVFSGRIKPW